MAIPSRCESDAAMPLKNSVRAVLTLGRKGRAFRRARQRRGFPARCRTAGLLMGGCASNPVTGRPDLVFQSEAGEIKRSKEVHPLIMQQFGGPYEDQQLQAYVERGRPCARAKASHRPELEYHFMVLDSEDINAFTTGGGYVYITRGIMNYLNSEAELAAVLGHEVGHVTARHPVRQQSKSTLSNIGAAAVGLFTGSADLAGLANYAGAALVSGYGRDQELEADRLGAEYLKNVGFAPDQHDRRGAAAEEPGDVRDRACS